MRWMIGTILAREANDWLPSTGRLASPTRSSHRIHSCSASTPLWRLRHGQPGGHFLHRRSAPLVETFDTGHPHKGDVPDAERPRAGRRGDVTAGLMDGAAIPLRGACAQRSTPTAGPYRVLFRTGVAQAAADRSESRSRTPMARTPVDRQIPQCGEPEPTPQAAPQEDARSHHDGCKISNFRAGSVKDVIGLNT